MPAFAEDDPEPESKVLDQGLLGLPRHCQRWPNNVHPTAPLTFPAPRASEDPAFRPEQGNVESQTR